MAENNKKGINAAKLMKKRAAKGRGGHEKAKDGFDRSCSNTLASHVDRWILRLKERNYSKRTLEMNRGALREFITWAEERDLRTPEQFTKLHLESFQRHLWRWKKKDGQPLGVSTQRQRIGAIQRLFSYLCRDNQLPANPASELDLPRKKQRALPKGLNQQELADLFNIPNVKDPLGVRDRAILETLYASAVRRSELVHLDLEDIDLAAKTVHVRDGKGASTGLFPLGKERLSGCKNTCMKHGPTCCSIIPKKHCSLADMASD